MEGLGEGMHILKKQINTKIYLETFENLIYKHKPQILNPEKNLSENTPKTDCQSSMRLLGEVEKVN